MCFAHISMMYFFFNDTATTEIYTLSLHDALPISELAAELVALHVDVLVGSGGTTILPLKQATTSIPILMVNVPDPVGRSEEHTSELQSRQYLVCRLLLEKKKNLTSLGS